MTRVVDASVAIKWVVQEAGTAEALALRGAGPLAAPDLLIAECANILWKKVARSEITAAHAELAARLLARADVDLYPMRNLLEPALRLSLDLNHPAYDCVYLALGLELGAPFVTADARLLRAVAAEPTGRFTGRVVGLGAA